MRVPCLLRDELLSLLQKSKRFYSSSFNVNYQYNNSYKLTISISAKYGKSVQRNLIKRRIYNLIHKKYKNIYIWIRINNKHTNTTYEEILYNISEFNKLISRNII